MRNLELRDMAFDFLTSLFAGYAAHLAVSANTNLFYSFDCWSFYGMTPATICSINGSLA